VATASSPLDSGAIAFNAPDEMRMSEIVRIQAALLPGKDTSSVRLRIEEPGPIRARVIEVSDSVQAELRGGAFEIRALYPEKRRLSRTRPTEWLWEVRPKNAGQQVLALTVSAWVMDAGTRDWVPIRTFREMVHVTVRPVPRRTLMEILWSFLYENWSKLLTVVVLPLLAGIWKWWRGRRTPQAPLQVKGEGERRRAARDPENEREKELV
jgi:hypothetical protein